ncbi:group 1 glycosyl transferase [Brevibacterium ihuae]|uniref:group 1 glycosyl transferase n=1 Tax=Brevibacterium ihuae TaxID=1631743 RepID=UPI001FE8E624|nr:group 1 glycosyl transferase [Brevibacterium ihuae]
MSTTAPTAAPDPQAPGHAPEVPVLPADARILHVLAETDGVIGEVAVLAIRSHLQAGFKVGVAARRRVLDALDLPADDPNLVHLDVDVRTGPRPGDPGRAHTLHRYYRHVDVVHAHGLHPAAVAGLGMTGLPARLRPALVATVGRFDPRSPFAAADAAIVARTAAVVLGTTEPVVEHFAEDVPVVSRARLLNPDVRTVYEPVRSRAQIREALGVRAGTVVVAVPLELTDHPALTTAVEAAVELSDHRPDRRWATVFTGSGRLRQTIHDEFVTRRKDIILADVVATVDVVAGADIVIAGDRMSAIGPEGIMQLARPVVHLGSARGARAWGDSAVHVDTDDTAGLLAAIAHYSDSPAARGTAGIAAKRRVVDISGHGYLAGELLDVYAADALPHRR